MTTHGNTILIGALIAILGSGSLHVRAVQAANGQSGEVIEIEEEVCGQDEIWLEDGGCAQCPLGYLPDDAQERCVEDPGSDVPPDPCKLDPALCVGPEDPSPDPDVPDACEGQAVATGSSPTDACECSECRAFEGECFEIHRAGWNRCRAQAILDAGALCQRGIAGPGASRPPWGSLPKPGEFNPFSPAGFVNRLDEFATEFLRCVDSHLNYKAKSIDGRTEVYGGLFGECDARLLERQRKCIEIGRCHQVCKGEGPRVPQSVDTKATAAEVVVRPVTVSLPTTHDGYLVDACRLWSRDCGLLTAHQYCRNRYGRASRAIGYQLVENIGAQSHTKTLLGGEVCDQDFCDGFASITCSVDVLPWRVEYPRLEAGRVAYCVAGGTTCGQPVADRFCRETFGASSYAGTASEDTEFAGAEPTVDLDGNPCNGSGCRAFRGITCRSPELLGQMLAQRAEDGDGDAVPSDVDNCPYEANSRLVGPTQVHQVDRDFDGQGDACDPEPDIPEWLSRPFKVAAQSGLVGSSPSATGACRAKLLPHVATWLTADVACMQRELERPAADGFKLCRAEAALGLANDVEDAVEAMRARGKECPLVDSPTAIFQMIDDLGGRAMLLYRLVLASTDLDDARERTVSRHALDMMATRATAAIRKAGKVVRGKRAKGYEALVRRLENALRADLEALEAEVAIIGIRVGSRWLAENTLRLARDVVNGVAEVE